MLMIFAAAALHVGGFAYRINPLSDRTKVVRSDPAAAEDRWKEHVETIVATSPGDRAFNAWARSLAVDLRDGFYVSDGDSDPRPFDRRDRGGWLDVDERVLAASPDLVSIMAVASYMETGDPHPRIDDGVHVVWSRRLGRVLRQDDVFARVPDLALRRAALARFDNRDGLQTPDDPNGLPLRWNSASIGPEGITWWYAPYELGSYLSAGQATLPWSVLRPYLRTRLPFAMAALRAAPA